MSQFDAKMSDGTITEKYDVISIHDSLKDCNKDQKSSITREEVDHLLIESGFTKFGEVQQLISTRIERCMNYAERKIVSDSLRAAYCAAAAAKRIENDNGHRGILIFTAYSEDYSIGKLCDSVNRSYAQKNNYKYIRETLSYDDMIRAIGPDKCHCTWYKVLMLKKLLIDDAEMLLQDKIQYLMWIDADAVVINDNIRIEEIIERGKGRDLIIAENMHSGCLVNAGVMLVRVSEWSKQLWQEVWDSKKYNTVTFFEQSALLQRLRAKREGLEMVGDDRPFHSYLPGGPKGVKLFAHVAVLPHLELNTNSGWQCQGRQIERSRARRIQKSRGRLKREELESPAADFHAGEEAPDQEGTRTDSSFAPFISEAGEAYPSEAAFNASEREVFEAYLRGEQLPLFIFHAAGHCGKLESLKGVLGLRGVSVPAELLSLDSFSIPKGGRSSTPLDRAAS